MQKNIIDQVFPETLKILSDLIKFQTVSGTSNLALIEYCEKRLNKVGALSFRTSETIPALFFFGKLQTPITCFPIKFCSS